jgi:site-specific recombinase XerD
MRTLGYRYRTQEQRLLNFDAFLQGRPDLANASPVVLLQEWLAVHATARRTRRCQALQADLAKAWRRIDADVCWPRPDPRLLGRVTRRRPRILAADEVQRLLDAALATPSPRTPLRPLALCAMLQIAYCMGMRRSEITRLTLGDVDLAVGTITVRDSKFFKSRVLPMSATLVKALELYVDTRTQAGGPQSELSAFFWHAKSSGRYCVENASGLLRKVFRRAGLKPAHGDGGARMHDVRHTFAVTRLTQWYREGVDVQARLPILATFMGHADIQFTTTYLSMTPELMQAASERFAAHSAQLRHAMTEVSR